jgi:exodeoxyribonuclease VII small subunit
MAKKIKKEEAPANFEKAMERLEAIVEAMEAGGLPLDEMMALLEEAQELQSFSEKKLNAAEQKITVLINRGRADGQTEPPIEIGPGDDVSQALERE